MFRVTVETGFIQFSSVAGNSKSGASTLQAQARVPESGILLEAVKEAEKRRNKRAPLLIGCIATCCHFKFKLD